MPDYTSIDDFVSQLAPQGQGRAIKKVRGCRVVHRRVHALLPCCRPRAAVTIAPSDRGPRPSSVAAPLVRFLETHRARPNKRPTAREVLAAKLELS